MSKRRLTAGEQGSPVFRGTPNPERKTPGIQGSPVYLLGINGGGGGGGGDEDEDMIGSLTVSEFDTETTNGTAQGATGYDVVFLEDGAYTAVWDGSAWAYYHGNFKCTLHNTTGWSFTNGGSSAADVDTKALHINWANGSSQFRIYGKAVSGAWTITALMRPLIFTGTATRIGLAVTDSSDNNVYSFGFSADGALIKRDIWTNLTTFSSSSNFGQPASSYGVPFFLRMQWNETNLIYSVSNDGDSWLQLLSEAPSNFSPTSAGFGYWADGAVDSALTVPHVVLA